MKGNIDLKSILGGFGDFFRRFHSIIFFGIVGIALAIALLIVLNTLTTSSSGGAADQQSIDSSTSNSFDQNTINTLRQSQNSGQSLSIPSGRINPFE